MQTSAESQLLWWLALATGVLVIIVVAALLTIVLTVASAIDDEAQTINQTAKDISGSTVQLLYALRVNATLNSIVGGAGLILQQAGRLAAHVQSCAGCPGCQASVRPPTPAAPEPAAAPAAARPRTATPAAGKAPWSWS